VRAGLTDFANMRGIAAAARAFGIPLTEDGWKSVRADHWFDDLRSLVRDGGRPLIVFLPNMQPIWPGQPWPMGHYVVWKDEVVRLGYPRPDKPRRRTPVG